MSRIVFVPVGDQRRIRSDHDMKIASFFDDVKGCHGRGREVYRRPRPPASCLDQEVGPMADLSRKLELTLAAVNYAAKRGEKRASERGCRLED